MSQSLLGCVIAQNKGRTRADDAAPKKIMKSDEEWKGILSPEQYYITRQAGTEEPYSSSLLNVHESGTFECVGPRSGCARLIMIGAHIFAPNCVVTQTYRVGTVGRRPLAQQP